MICYPTEPIIFYVSFVSSIDFSISSCSESLTLLRFSLSMARSSTEDVDKTRGKLSHILHFPINSSILFYSQLVLHWQNADLHDAEQRREKPAVTLYYTCLPAEAVMRSTKIAGGELSR